MYHGDNVKLVMETLLWRHSLFSQINSLLNLYRFRKLQVLLRIPQLQPKPLLYLGAAYNQKVTFL